MRSFLVTLATPEESTECMKSEWIIGRAIARASLAEGRGNDLAGVFSPRQMFLSATIFAKVI